MQKNVLLSTFSAELCPHKFSPPPKPETIDEYKHTLQILCPLRFKDPHVRQHGWSNLACLLNGTHLQMSY